MCLDDSSAPQRPTATNCALRCLESDWYGGALAVTVATVACCLGLSVSHGVNGCSPMIAIGASHEIPAFCLSVWTQL